MDVDVGLEPAERNTSSSVSSAQTRKENPEKKTRFEVELKPGETTIVSWKNLMKLASKESASSASDTSLHNDAIVMFRKPPADNAFQDEMKDGKFPTSRLTNVIEKIERLYMGNVNSDDEDVGTFCDEEQYNSKDSFIDDTELNDYFEIDKFETKHTGFFVNRGKLEPLESSLSPNTALKKRSRNESSKQPDEKVHTNMPDEHVEKNSNVKKTKLATNDAQVVLGKLPRPSLSDSSELMRKRIDKKRTDPLTNLNISPSLKLKNKDPEKQKGRSTLSRVVTNNFRGSGESLKLNDQGVLDKSILSHVDSHIKNPSKLRYGTAIKKKIQHKENTRPSEFDLNSPIAANICPMKLKGNEGSAVRPGDMRLESAILDLERTVLELPSKLDAHEADASQSVRKTLPAEVKQKLDKVTRLADSQGKIGSESFFNHLVGILGHLLRPKILKRHLREVVELRLAVKQKKADKIRQIKKETMKMIKTLVLSSKYQDAVAKQQTNLPNAFEVNPREKAYRSKCFMTDEIEDKIFDLNALYVVEADEDMDLQTRKLYAELVQFWPAGHMNSHGIRDAIHRAKERKRALNKQKCKIQGSESLKRKRPSSSCTIEECSRSSQRPTINCSGKLREPFQKLTIDSAGKGKENKSSLSGGNGIGIGSNQVICLSDKIPESMNHSTGWKHQHVSNHDENVFCLNFDVDDEENAPKRMNNKLKRGPETDLEEVSSQVLSKTPKRARPL